MGMARDFDCFNGGFWWVAKIVSSTSCRGNMDLVVDVDVMMMGDGG